MVKLYDIDYKYNRSPKVKRKSKTWRHQGRLHGEGGVKGMF